MQSDNLNNDLLLEQYRQCNEHLRESDRKRDITLGTYITLSVALYGFSGRVSTDDVLLFFGIVGLVIVGILIGFLFTLYRGWHGVYVIQAVAFHEIIHKGRYRYDINNAFIRGVDFNFNYLTSIELIMFVMLHAVVFLNCGAAMWISSNDTFLLVARVLTAILSVEFLSHFVAMWILDYWKRTGKLGTKYLWLLQHTIKKFS